MTSQPTFNLTSQDPFQPKNLNSFGQTPHSNAEASHTESTYASGPDFKSLTEEL